MSCRRGIGAWLAAPGAFALAGSLAFGVAGCSPPVRAVVANESGARLTELRVVGVQDSSRVRDLAPGESLAVAVRVSGEDALVLRGRLEGRGLQPAMAIYVEGGAVVSMRVDTAGAVHVESRARGY